MPVAPDLPPEKPGVTRARIVEPAPAAPPAAAPPAPPPAPPPASPPLPGPARAPPIYRQAQPPAVPPTRGPPPRPPTPPPARAPVAPPPRQQHGWSGYSQPAAPPAAPYSQPPAYSQPYGYPQPPAYAQPYAYSQPYGASPYGYSQPHAQPYGYAPPYGYTQPYGGLVIYPYAPVAALPPGYSTFEGLRYLKYATYGMLVFSLLALLNEFALLGAVGEMREAIRTMNLAHLDAADQMLNYATGLFGLGLFIGLVSALYAFAGMSKLNDNASSFGAEHQAFAKRGIGLTVVAALLYIIIGLWYLTANAGMGALLDSDDPAALAQAADIYVNATIGMSLVAVLAALCAGVAMLSFTKRLSTNAGRSKERLFLVLSLAGPVTVLITALALRSVIGPIDANAGSTPRDLLNAFSGLLNGLFWMSVGPAIANVLTILALLVFVRIVQSADEGAHNMVRSGVFDPDQRMPPAGSQGASASASAGGTPAAGYGAQSYAGGPYPR